MTVSLDSRTDANNVLEAARDLLPEIRARASEMESARRVSLDLLDGLKEAGCFGLLLPAGNGGTGSDLPSAMRVFEMLSRADASVGWITLIGAGTWFDLAGLPRATFDDIYRPGHPAVVAGVFNPTGTATPVSDGFQVNGRWAFASGCQHADWIYGNCIDTSSGEPELRVVVFRPDEIEIEDTWSVVGLCATGSHHFNARDVVVPAARTARLFADHPSIASPFTNLPVPGVIALLLATVPVGIAQGALDDVLELATEKVPLLASAPLAANPGFQYRLADAEAQLRAARSLLYQAATEAWSAAVDGDEFTPAHRARIRSTAVLATTTAATVVETAYRAAGSSSLYLDSPLQRRLRDVQAVSQHFLVKPDTLTTCGAVLAGQDPDLTIF